MKAAVLSEDAVSVQVTDMGNIDDPLGSATQNMPGLGIFGDGQDLPIRDQSLKLTRAHCQRITLTALNASTATPSTPVPATWMA